MRGELRAFGDDGVPASWSAEPATASAREPPVRPAGVRSVSPIITSILSASMPSWSDTICL